METIEKKMFIDLNADLGEGFAEADRELPDIITSANISCGAHTDDIDAIDACVAVAKSKGVSLGAHVSYFDRKNFGRRNVLMRSKDLAKLIEAELVAFEFASVTFQYVKPHGALYNKAVVSNRVAKAIVDGIVRYNKDLYLLCPYNSAMHRQAESIGLKCAFEFFADRAYTDRGRLVKRKLKGAVITDADEIIARTVKAIKCGTVTTVNGREIPVRMDSVCVHGDTPNAVAIAKKLKEALINEGIELRPFVR